MTSDSQMEVGVADVAEVTSLCSTIALGVVCPMANEETAVVNFVREVLERCSEYPFRSLTFFAILDNQSKDRTMALLEELVVGEPRLKIVWAPENTCVADAYIRGYREAIQSGCDWILEMDCGFSHQPDDIAQFFQKMTDNYDCVFGSRFCTGGKISDSSLPRYIVSRGGSILARVLLGTSLKDMTSGFELFTRSALAHVLSREVQSRGPFFQSEIKAYCSHLKITEVPIHYKTASHAINAFALSDAFRNLWRLFRLRLRGDL